MNNNELIKNTNIIKFANKISPNASLEIIPVKKESFSTINNCYDNVKKQVLNKGGKIIYGWIIHIDYQFATISTIQAEAHAIWSNNKKEKICISSQDSKEILFLQDNSDFIKNNYPVPNYRYSLINGNDNLLKLMELQDFLNIYLKKYIISIMKSSKKQFTPILKTNENEQLIVHYGNQKVIVLDPDIIKKYQLLKRIIDVTNQENIKINKHNLLNEFNYISNELNYTPIFFIK